MKTIKDWVLPSNEIHMIPFLEKDGEYQLKHRTTALKYVKNWNTAIDIGGHIGTWGRDLARQFSILHVFEPVDEFRACYEENLREHPKSDVVFHDCLLGNIIDTTDMVIDTKNTGHSHIDPNLNGTTFQIMPLDSFGIDNVGFIKIDVEGYEEFVVRGGEGTILRSKPIINLEQKAHLFYKGASQYGAKEYLESLGMVVLNRYSDDWVLGWK